MKKITPVVALLIFSLVIVLNASEYQKWLQNEQDEYKNYKKSLDEEFANMLKNDWESFKTSYNTKPYEKPKPVEIPKTIEKQPSPITVKNSQKITIPKIEPIQVEKPIIRPTRVNLPNFQSVKLDFYSQNVNIDYDVNTKININSFTKNDISNYWYMMSKTDYQKLITQIDNYSDSLNLNDWGRYKLVYSIGYEIYYNESLANLFTWFLFSKMGYDVRIGYSNSKVYFLISSLKKIYQVAFFTLEGKRYYVITPEGRIKSIGAIATYKGSYSGANRPISLDVNRELNFVNDVAYKSLDFHYNGKAYHINAKYPKSLVEFYKTYPQSDYEIYFDAKKSPYLYSMLNEIKPIISSMSSEVEAVNFLLRFTQKSFEYKTDLEQFGYEKVLFPEETLYYPNSDCEDRSIFFSYLIKNLTKLDIVGIKYSNHLATAVAFSNPINEGDSFMFEGKRYTISDPTYINANVGLAMPQYKNANFQVIKQK